MMRPGLLLAAAILGAGTVPAFAQDALAPGLGEVVVTGNRNNARYAQQDRPVVGLRRQADAVVLQIAVASDTRDEATRKREIHSMLLAAIDRAGAAGVELVTGGFELTPVTRATYQDLPLGSAGRVDTSQASLMIKVKLAGSIADAEKRLDAFIKSVPRTGSGMVDRNGVPALTIVNPDQYRDDIYRRIATGSTHALSFYGPDYALDLTGLDEAIAWKQVSNTEVFLYIPYTFSIRK